jgi:hypothetical protein
MSSAEHGVWMGWLGLMGFVVCFGLSCHLHFTVTFVSPISLCLIIRLKALYRVYRVHLTMCNIQLM